MTSKVITGHIRSSLYLKINFSWNLFYLKSDLIETFYECYYYEYAKFLKEMKFDVKGHKRSHKVTFFSNYNFSYISHFYLTIQNFLPKVTKKMRTNKKTYNIDPRKCTTLFISLPGQGRSPSVKLAFYSIHIITWLGEVSQC